MKKKILLLGLVAMAFGIYAQTTGKVGVNTNEPKEILEVNGTVKVVDLLTDGANKIYNGSANKTAPYKSTRQVVADADGVLGTKELEKVWFYMPSIVLPLSVDTWNSHPYKTNITTTGNNVGSEAITFTIDLYEIYKQQFGAPSYKTSATENLKLYNKEELEFFVVYYDTNVFNNVRFTADKKLQYTIASGDPVTEHTFMNIVFKVK